VVVVNNDIIIEKLKSFNFSKAEAQVYMTLIRYGELNGSQVSKLIGLNRGTVYTALNNLYERGAIVLLPEQTNVYRAENPKTLIENLTEKYIQEYKNSAELLKKEFEKMEEKDTVKVESINLKGYMNFILKAKSLIYSAESELYIETNDNLIDFYEEFRELVEKDVDLYIRVYTNDKVTELVNEDFPESFNEIEFNNDNSKERKTMIVVDNEKALIGNGKKGDDFIATFTNNNYLVSIISDRIHYSIYLDNIVKNEGLNYLKKHKINTLHEENILKKIKKYLKI
jgi:sugar-specific transcriptional regulator TrmB